MPFATLRRRPTGRGSYSRIQRLSRSLVAACAVCSAAIALAQPAATSDAPDPLRVAASDQFDAQEAAKANKVPTPRSLKKLAATILEDEFYRSVIGHPIMQYTGGHSSTSAIGLNENGKAGYAARLVDEKEFLRYFRGNQWPRIFFKNPYGAWRNRTDQPASLDWYNMWFDQELVAERMKVPFAAVEDTRAICQWFLSQGAEEIIFYYGRPDMVEDPLVYGRECLRKFRQCGPANKLSIGFDAASEISARGSWKLTRTLALFDELRAEGRRVGIEAIPPVGEDAWKGHIDFVICLKSFAEKNPDRVQWVLAGGLGDVELIINTNDAKAENDNLGVVKAMPRGTTPLMRRHYAYEQFDGVWGPSYTFSQLKAAMAERDGPPVVAGLPNLVRPRNAEDN